MLFEDVSLDCISDYLKEIDISEREKYSDDFFLFVLPIFLQSIYIKNFLFKLMIY